MKFMLCLRLLGLLVICASPAMAQVTNFAAFKVTVYHQTNSAAPTAPDFPNAYYFGAQVNLYEFDYYQSADLYWNEAPSTSPAADATMTLTTPYFLYYGSDYYSSKAAFDADFGDGDYEIDATLFDSPSYDSGYLTIPSPELYSTNIAAYTPDSWTQMQSVNPNHDLSLNLNSFDVLPGADEALTFVNVFNPTTGNSAYATNGTSLLLTNVFIPAGSLQYGVTYRVDTFFSSRINTPNAGFNNALGTMGFDNLTYTEITTIPPPLTIAANGNNIVLSWPSLASNYILESTTNLLAPQGWNYVTNIVQPPGLTNSASFPVTDSACFYRLTSFFVISVDGGGGGGGGHPSIVTHPRN